MIRYENLGNTIAVDITSICAPLQRKDSERRYIVECFYCYHKDTDDEGNTTEYYQIEDMWLLRKDVELKIHIAVDPISGLKDETLRKADRTNVKGIIRDIIVSLAKSTDYFGSAIEQMDYIVECFDVGDEILWKEEQGRIADRNDLS